MWQPSSTEYSEINRQLLARAYVILESRGVTNRMPLLQNIADEFHPALFSLAYLVQSPRTTIRAVTLDRISNAISESRRRALFNREVIGEAIDLAKSSDRIYLQVSIDSAKVMVSNIHAMAKPDFSICQTITHHQAAIVRSALGILGQAWPAALDELKQGVKQIVFFRSHKIIGFADIHTHGAIFLRHETIADPVRLAEEILHESSHVRMNATLACQDYYVDDGRLFESPLRRDARPIFGLLHQLFVLRRLMSFYERIRSGVHQHRLELIQSHFKAAFKTIHSEAKLTSKGMDFLKSMEI